jgi:hypothetical protein
MRTDPHRLAKQWQSFRGSINQVKGTAQVRNCPGIIWIKTHGLLSKGHGFGDITAHQRDDAGNEMNHRVRGIHGHGPLRQWVRNTHTVRQRP